MELYKTVRKQAEAVQVIDKSRFIARVCPVESREEADAFLAEIREKYKDATHNVPAMVIGDKSQIQWASDDGEPQGTSGAPMVQMMVKEDALFRRDQARYRRSCKSIYKQCQAGPGSCRRL